MKLARHGGILLALVFSLCFATAAFAEREANPNATDLVLKGDAKCTGCHDEADEPSPTMLELHPGVLRIGKTRHGTRADSRTPTCTDCHGESKDHLNYKGSGKPPHPDRVFKKPGLSSAEARNEACLACHEQDARRSHWSGSTHQLRDVACTDCHQIHTADDRVRDKRTQPDICFTCHKEQRAQINRPSHHPIPEGKMSCSDCHNPHGTTNENLLKVRAPFLCHQCHTPHGGFIPQLIGAQVTPNSPTFNGKSTTNLTQGRSCLNCHTQVHGSNNPAVTNPSPQFNLR